MGTRDLARKALKAAGLLDFTRSLRRAFRPAEQVFAPCTPHLLIAVGHALRRLHKEGKAEGTDTFEFGVYRGFTLWYTQALAKDLGLAGMRHFGFDSFAGLPDPQGVDATGEQAAFYEGAYKAGRALVESSLTRLGTDWDRTVLVEGFYDQSLTEQARKDHGLRRCSLCVIDCDLYESTRPALEFCAPHFFDGSIVLFDEWYAYDNRPDRGEQLAFAEFLAKHPRFRAEPLLEIGKHGKGFVLRCPA